MPSSTDVFADIVGPANVLTDEAATPHLEEWTGRAEAVVNPASVDDVSALVRAACVGSIPVTGQGGNTSVSGGSIPARRSGFVRDRSKD